MQVDHSKQVLRDVLQIARADVLVVRIDDRVDDGHYGRRRDHAGNAQTGRSRAKSHCSVSGHRETLAYVVVLHMHEGGNDVVPGHIEADVITRRGRHRGSPIKARLGERGRDGNSLLELGTPCKFSLCNQQGLMDGLSHLLVRRTMCSQATRLKIHHAALLLIRHTVTSYARRLGLLLYRNKRIE